MLRLFGACGLALTAMLFGWLVYVNSLPVDVGALRQSAAASEPDWTNYQEDIKAQIGAKPVAQWEGRPVSARQTGPRLELAFAVSGTWAGEGLAVPVLLRDPTGRTYRHRETAWQDGQVTYIFDLADAASTTPLPWIELRFPHAERRLTFTNNGLWRSPEQETPAR